MTYNLDRTPLSDLCEAIVDCEHKTAPKQDFGIPSIRTTDIKNGRLDIENANRVSEETYIQWTARLEPQPNDLILAREAPVGEVGIVPLGQRVCLGQRTVLIRPDKNKLFPRYLLYLLLTSQMRHALTSRAEGSVVPHLNMSAIRGLELPLLPPLDEQKAIAHILGTLDDKIELNQQMNQTLEAIARALFKSWFIDFDPVRAKLDGRQPIGMDAETAALFPAEFEDSAIGKIPKGWNVGMLRDCCDRVENGGTPKRSESDYWEPGTIPWLTSGEVRQSIVTVTENFISEKGLANSSAKLWTPRTTVVAMYGATAGQVCLLAQKMCTNQACCGLIPAKNKQFFIYLQASNSVELLAQQARGSAQQNLSQKIVGDFPTVIPSDSVLKSFDEYVKSLFEKWIANLEESKSLASIRDALLPKLLSGEIRVQDAETVVEAVT